MSLTSGRPKVSAEVQVDGSQSRCGVNCDWLSTRQHAVVAFVLDGLLERAEDRELVVAFLAPVVLRQLPPRDIEPVPADRDRAAFGAVRVLQRVPRDVPDVHVPEAGLLRDLAVLLEGLHRR